MRKKRTASPYRHAAKELTCGFRIRAYGERHRPLSPTSFYAVGENTKDALRGMATGAGRVRAGNGEILP